MSKKKFLVDECIPRSMVTGFIDAGFDMKSSTDYLGFGVTDEEIFQKAQELDCTVLTLDRGFGDIFRFNIQDSSGVVIVLLNNFTKEEINTIPVAFIKSYEKSLEGKLIIIGKTKVRVIDR